MFLLILALLNLLLILIEALDDKDNVEKIPILMNGLTVALVLINFYFESR